MIKPPPAGVSSDAQKLQRLQRLSLLTSGASEPTAADTAEQAESGQGRGTAALLGKAVAPVESDPPAPTPPPVDAAVGNASQAQPRRAAALFTRSLHAETAMAAPATSELTSVAVREPLNSINLVLPPSVFDAIERAAISRRWTKKCLVLAALQQFGVDIPDSALVPDGRKIRGRRLAAS